MKLAAASLVADDVGADDVRGHQVGRELDARKAHGERLPQRTDQYRLAQPGDAFQQDVPAGDERDHGVAEELFLTDDQTGELGFERLRQLGHAGCVDARFFGDHDPPSRFKLFRTGSSLLPELGEVLADEVALAPRNQALVGSVQRRLLVSLDHLAVRAERHVLTGSERGGIVLRLAGHGLARHIDPLGALRARAAPRPCTVRACAPRSARPARPRAGAGPAATATPVAGSRTTPAA